jgi:hypothetical protein
MTDPLGINLLPASNEWVYDPLPHRAARSNETTLVVQNQFAGGSGGVTDYTLALDQLQASLPGCGTVSLVCAWFGNALDMTTCAVYPSTTFIGGSSEVQTAGGWVTEPWLCSGLTQVSPGLIPLSQTTSGRFVYGGTPSDPSIVRCIRDLKARGLRVTFYPFLLMDCPGYPWRGRITFNGSDISSAATAAIDRWLGSASATQFVRDTTNLTVTYTGSPTDWTYRRMILHYANLCVLAGGVDLFLIGSELRGLETLRGPNWTPAGTVQSDGTAAWDYPFVAGLVQLAGDVRHIFDTAGLTKDGASLHNLIAYSADWSNWMGYQHPGANGQWPHLDALYASPDIDLVSFDNYLPLSDWTTATGGLDAANWSVPAPTSWPPAADQFGGLGLAQPPSLATKAYLKANIEGGEKFNWFYADGANLGRGFDPLGSVLQVSCPQGDRLIQRRTPYQPGQQILANKMLRWWWANPHYAVYDAADGQGWVAHGAPSAWLPQAKSITFAEYGFPTCDKCTNQPNVFYDPKSVESFTPYWSAWESAEGGIYRPVRDDTLAALAREAIVEYWTSDGHNVTSAAGVKMIEPTFMCAWNWDARPFPVFPQSNNWGDSANWRAGTWVEGKGPSYPPAAPDAAPPPSLGPLFPTFTSTSWSLTYRPVFLTEAALHISGRESRSGRNAAPLWEITLHFDSLSDEVRADLQLLMGFYDRMAGAADSFQVTIPSELGLGATLACRFADDTLDVEAFMQHVYAVNALVLRSMR